MLIDEVNDPHELKNIVSGRASAAERTRLLRLMPWVSGEQADCSKPLG
jgi:hypothetical protein